MEIGSHIADPRPQPVSIGGVLFENCRGIDRLAAVKALQFTVFQVGYPGKTFPETIRVDEL